MYLIEILEDKFKEELFTQKEESLYEKINSLPTSELVKDLTVLKKEFKNVQKASESQTKDPLDQIKSKLESHQIKIE